MFRPSSCGPRWTSRGGHVSSRPRRAGSITSGGWWAFTDRKGQLHLTRFAGDTGKVIRPPGWPNQRVLALAVSADSRLLATADDARRVYVWERSSGRQFQALDVSASAANVKGMVFTPDNRHLLLVEQGGRLHQCDVPTGKLIRTYVGHSGFVMSVRFSPNGQMLASSGSYDGTVRLWDVATGKKRLDPEG